MLARTSLCLRGLFRFVWKTVKTPYSAPEAKQEEGRGPGQLEEGKKKKKVYIFF